MFRPADPEVTGFLLDVYAKMLPAFNSSFFNINCDEAYDLELVPDLSPKEAFLKHVSPLLAYLSRRGKRPMIWGDMLVQMPHLLDELEVRGNGPNPPGHFRKLVVLFLTELYRLAVFFRIQEKLTLPDQPCSAVDLMHKVKEPGNLFRRIWRTSLLAVTERRIRNPDVLGQFHGNTGFFEYHPGKMIIRKCLPEQIRFVNVLQFVL